MKINAIQLNKIISVVCAVVIALTTFIYSGVSAFATLGTALWSTWDAADEAAQQLAQLYHKTAAAMDNTKAFKQAYPNWYDLPIEWICSHVDVASDIAEAGITATYLLTPAGDLYYYIDDLGNLCVYERVGAGGEARYGASGGGGRPKTVDTSNDTPIFSGDNYADIIRRLNDQYGIKNAKEYISIRTDKRWDYSKSQGRGPISFFEEGEYCGQTNWLDCYILPFYFDGSQYWFGLMERYYSQTVETDDSGNHIYMDVNVFSVIDDTISYTARIVDTDKNVVDFANYRYMELFCSATSSTFLFGRMYDTYSNYIGKSSGKYTYAHFSSYDTSKLNSLYRVYSESCLRNSGFDEYKDFATVYAYAYSNNSNYVDGLDVGYFISDEPIEMGLNWTGIDPEKINPDTFITMEGDTIYDNSITNYEGDTTTINEYINNNYNFDIDINIEGDTIIDIDFGDFLLEITSSIETAISNTINFFFVPEQDVIDSGMDKIKLEIENKLPWIYDIADLLDALFYDVVQQDKDHTITFVPDVGGDDFSFSGDDGASGNVTYIYPYPKWTINLDWYGHDMTITVLDFEMFADYLPTIKSLILVFIYIVYIRNLIQYLPTLIGNVMQMSSSAVSADAIYDHYRDQAELQRGGRV